MFFIPVEAPFDFTTTLRRFAAYGADAANFFDGAVFRKLIGGPGGPHLLSLFRRPGGVALAVTPAVGDPADFVAAARAILGLDFPLQAFYAFAQSDPVLRHFCERYPGYRPTLTPDLFEMMVTSITAQQINLRFAFTVRSRLVRRYGDSLVDGGRRYYAFPGAARLAAAAVADLRSLQLTERKSAYIIGLARAIVSGALNLPALRHAGPGEIAEKLLPLKGVGQWTVDWLLARGLGRGDAFPAGDLGVKKVVEKYYFQGAKRPEPEIRAFAQRWGEFANLAAHYLLLDYLEGSG